MTEALLTDWGRRIRERREALGLTQTELAKRVGTTQQWLSAWERGGAEPRTASKIALAHALDSSTEDLFPITVGAA